MIKRIWILWFQGWDQAPRVARLCLDSWVRLNPDWEIVLLTEKNITDYVPEAIAPRSLSLQKRSDLIRLYLMHAYGGVWTDASVMCLRPLDEWLPLGRDFWMYRGQRWMKIDGRWHPHEPVGLSGACGWFMASKSGSRIPLIWISAMQSYLGAHGDDDYFLIDKTFIKLLEGNAEFSSLWLSVPHSDALEPGGPAALARIETDQNPEVVAEIVKRHPNIIKLTYVDEGLDCNVNSVIREACRLTGQNFGGQNVG